METKTQHGFTFYLLTSYAPAVIAPLLLMSNDGITLTSNPGIALSFAILYGALIGLADRELLEPARRAADQAGSLVTSAVPAFLMCALAGAGLYTLISVVTAT